MVRAMTAALDTSHTFQVNAWRDGPFWLLEVEPAPWMPQNYCWATQTPWFHLAEYMAKDLIFCMLDLDYKHWDQVKVNATKGIGPCQDYGSYPWSSWLWAQWAGIVDTYKFWRVRRDARRRNRR